MNNSNHTYVLIALLGCFVYLGCKSVKQPASKVESPDYFTASFETSKGIFNIESRKDWSPDGVDRLYQLIQSGFYTDIAIFRVIPDYIAQFGIHNDSLINKKWDELILKDEPVVESNTIGTLSFARGGPNTRGAGLFINLNDNAPFLDTVSFMDVTGFPVVAKITSGLDVAQSLYSGYGASLDNKQDTIYMLGNDYLSREYPKLDYIHRAYITDN